MRAILLTLLLSVASWAEGAFGTWKVNPGPNASMQVSGCLADLQGAVGGSRFVIDGENNRLLSIFGGIVQIPWGPFATRASRFRLYVDGVQAASKDVTYRVPYRH